MTDPGRKRRMSRKRRRQRQLRIIYTSVILLVVAIAALAIGSTIHSNQKKNDQIRAAKAAEIEAEEKAIAAKRAEIGRAHV